MKIFGKNKETLRIKKVKASRAVFIDTNVQEVELKVMTEDKEMLTLILTPQLTASLIQQLTVSYTAINPPLMGAGHLRAGWEGME